MWKWMEQNAEKILLEAAENMGLQGLEQQPLICSQSYKVLIKIWSSQSPDLYHIQNL